MSQRVIAPSRMREERLGAGYPDFHAAGVTQCSCGREDQGGNESLSESDVVIATTRRRSS